MTKTATVVPQELIAAKHAAVLTTKPVLEQVQSVIITDPDSYLTADVVLARIRQARGYVEARLEVLIKPAYDALQAIYALKRELTGPLDQGEKAVKEKMKEYKLEEGRIVAEKKAADDRLRRETEDKLRAADQARTAQMKARLAAQAAVMQAEADKAADVIITPVKVSGSSARTITKVGVTSMLDLLVDIAAGNVPMDVVMPNQQILNAYLKDDRKSVEGWKGVKVWDDITIVGR